MASQMHRLAGCQQESPNPILFDGAEQLNNNIEFRSKVNLLSFSYLKRTLIDNNDRDELEPSPLNQSSTSKSWQSSPMMLTSSSGNQGGNAIRPTFIDEDVFEDAVYQQTKVIDIIKAMLDQWNTRYIMS